MLGENTYDNTDESASLAARFGSGMDARLNDIDRRAVDFLLSGEPADTRDAQMPQINAARRVLAVLGAMSVEDPSGKLAEATLQKVAAAQVVSAQNPPSNSASL